MKGCNSDATVSQPDQISSRSETREFVFYIASLMADPEMVSSVGEEGRRHANESSWRHAFQEIYQAYRLHLADAKATVLNRHIRSLNGFVPLQPLS
jgi:hypothetical protein